MASEGGSSDKVSRASVSVFELPEDFFEGARLFRGCGGGSRAEPADAGPGGREGPALASSTGNAGEEDGWTSVSKMSRWSCNTCRVEFESLEDQRSHFKSDFHRFNVKLVIAGKTTISEDNFDELGRESSLNDYEISSISGSDDESDEGMDAKSGALDEVGKDVAGTKQKLMLSLPSGEIVSLWKCLLLSDMEDLLIDNDSMNSEVNSQCAPCLREADVVKRLKNLSCEPHDGTHLRIVLLASGGHFAGCVFDGNSVIAHKTFHRYVVRAKSGKKQSTKDGTGKAANSAGSSLRRYNEAALKRDISELLDAWKPYFGASSCIFLHAPSNRRQLFFENEKSVFNYHENAIRHVPLTVRRPTLKEAKHVYNQLTRIAYVDDVQSIYLSALKHYAPLHSVTHSIAQDLSDMKLDNHVERAKRDPSEQLYDCNSIATGIENDIDSALIVKVSENRTTPLHEAAKSGNAQQTLELLVQGLDPCIKDERGRTPYMLALNKEVRNTFRRFMASNLEQWDWHAANVPSPLTNELEESQAAKQAEKEARRKARAKELKKLRKAKEKAQARLAVSQASTTVSVCLEAGTVLNHKRQSSLLPSAIAEEEKRAALAAEREKRAAAAEKRIAESRNTVTGSNTTSSHDHNSGAVYDDVKCSCCMASLAGKVPFHSSSVEFSCAFSSKQERERLTYVWLMISRGTLHGRRIGAPLWETCHVTINQVSKIFIYLK